MIKKRNDIKRESKSNCIKNEFNQKQFELLQFLSSIFFVKSSIHSRTALTEMSCSSSSPGKWRKRNVPQSARGVVNGAAEPSRCGCGSLWRG